MTLDRLSIFVLGGAVFSNMHSLLTCLVALVPCDLAKLVVGFVGSWPLLESPEPVVQLLGTQTTGFLITTHPSQKIRFYSINTGSLVDTWSLPASGKSRHVCLDPLDRFLYVNRVNGDIAQYDLTTKVLVRLFKVPRSKRYSKKIKTDRLSTYPFPIYANVKLSEDGKILITATADLERSVVLFNTETGQVIATCQGYYLIRSVTLCNHFVSIAYSVPETTLWDYTGNFVMTFEESGVSCYVPRLKCVVVSKPNGLFVNDMSDDNETRFKIQRCSTLMPLIDCFQMPSDQTRLLGSNNDKPYIIQWTIVKTRFIKPRVVARFSQPVQQFIVRNHQVFALLGKHCIESFDAKPWNSE